MKKKKNSLQVISRAQFTCCIDPAKLLIITLLDQVSTNYCGKHKPVKYNKEGSINSEPTQQFTVHLYQEDVQKSNSQISGAETRRSCIKKCLLVTNLARGDSLLQSLGFCGSPILVSSTHVDHIVAPSSTVTSIYISTQDTCRTQIPQRYVTASTSNHEEEEPPQ